MRRWSSPLVVAAALTVLVPGCSDTDGRTLPPPGPDQTTTTATSPPATEGPPVIAAPFELQSPAFADGEALPDLLTCTGAGLSPALTWTGTPADAVELALVARDRDAGGLVHWTVTGIDPLVQGVGEGGVPEGAVEGSNGEGGSGWLPPCSPEDKVHTYEVVLHALPSILALPPGATGEEVAVLIESSSSERAVLTGTLGPWPELNVTDHLDRVP